MSINIKYIRKAILSLVCLLAIGGYAWGQESGETVMPRKALVGEGCIINQVGQDVALVNSYDNLGAITDEYLTNYATISGVNIGLGVRPLVSVKDTKNTYEPGTTAGFSIVSEGGGLLGVDLVNMFTIVAYGWDENGNPTTEELVVENVGSGVSLDLLKIPGTNAVSIDLEVKPTIRFNELFLMVGGVEISALESVGIKYAFVGEAQMHPLTIDEMANLGHNIDLDACEAMPWPVESSWRDDNMKDLILDSNLENKITTGLIAIGEWCHVHIAVDKDKDFEAGTEVGFKYTNAGLLDLSLGGFTTIKLYNDGDEVQSERIEASLLGLGVAESGETITSIVANVPFDAVRLTIGAGLLSVSLGEIAVYYGFIKEKPVVNHHCEINPNISATLCNGENSYELTSDVPVTWTLTSITNAAGENIMNNSGVTLPTLTATQTTKAEISATGTVVKVENMMPNCTYEFEASATNCPYHCTETITLHKGVDGSTVGTCGAPIINKEGEPAKYEASIEWHETSGSLLSISDVNNPDFIVDADEDGTYATYSGGLGLVSNLGIIGVKTVDGSLFSLTDENGNEKKKRVGFVVENASTLLSADILQYFQIRLYKNGVRQNGADDAVVDEANTIGVGLIETDNSLKMRFSIEVPANMQFDEFQLWSSGVLKLDISKLRIYYGFVEDADDNCSDPARTGCAEYVTVDNSPGMKIIPDIFSTLGVGVVVTDVDKLMDDDLNTAMLVAQGASALSQLEFTVDLGRVVDSRQQLCLALGQYTHVLSLDLLNQISLITYRDGIVQERFEDGINLLGLDVIGYGDKKYRIFRPKYSYDQVKISIGSLLTAASDMKIYGLFFRSDIDGDGLPDSLDTNPCPGELSDIAVTEDICVGDFVHLTGLCSLDAGEEDDSYDVYLVSPDNSEKLLASLSFDKNNLMIDENFKIEGITPGQNYQLKLKRTKADAEK